MDARSMLDALGGYSSDEDNEQQAVVEEDQQAVVEEDQQAVVEEDQQAVVEEDQQAEPIISVTSKRDQTKMTHNQFVFWKDRNSRDGGRTFWACIKKEDGCSKRIHTSIATGRVVKEMGVHNHEADPTAIQVAQFKTSLKRRAIDTMENPAQIFNAVLPASQAVQSKVTKSASRKTVQRSRIREEIRPAIPGDINFVIPDAYRSYDNERFLLADSNDENRILLFGRENHRDWANQMKVVFADGTFSITPLPFQQVYVILAERSGFVFPVMYALLLNKQQQTYEKMFEMIKAVWPTFAPTSFSVDFELAVINAIEQVFPGVKMFGCLFHMVQNMKKQLGSHGLKRRYDSEPDFAIQCRMISALAFVPPGHEQAIVRAAANELWENLPDELDPVMEYFMRNYVGQEVMQGRRLVFKKPLFENALWTVYQRTLDGSHRTNNYAEAANRRIHAELGVSHPSLWHFIDCLKEIQKGRDQLYAKWLRGDRPKSKRTEYVKADTNILAVVEDYENRNLMDYLRGIALNFVMGE